MVAVPKVAQIDATLKDPLKDVWMVESCICDHVVPTR